ncbi:AzlD domain-containing protein [Jannaschia aquimarina]|uniref:Branched-chain amino acid transport protein (AzlD) n=1 Tax=Jannaschia aquimarina TaxID=935700 RepID=A0A0D1EF31_9RHOB|nr:AzlD domain-containing protein [Jannaschia aquimarina]KIT15501.1 Branched-chain amino acid transport protein (AzlD) [Jannaschia aquimarina]SNT34198.1 Branched-chain amino acid transport protein (AzlD) [Jannaschia aquimarina]
MSDYPIWAIIALLGVLTYLTRFSFLGLVGDRPLPPWVLRHLRYTGVAVLPGLVAPLVFSPGSEADPVKIAAAATALLMGAWRRDVIQAALGGALVLAAGNWIL